MICDYCQKESDDQFLWITSSDGKLICSEACYLNNLQERFKDEKIINKMLKEYKTSFLRKLKQ